MAGSEADPGRFVGVTEQRREQRSDQVSADQPVGLTRPMSEADLAAVLRIEQQVYAYPWSAGIFRDCLRAGYGCFVHEVDRAVGHLVVSCAAGEAQLLNIVIDPAWQRQGIAYHLLNVALERAQLLGAEMLYLEVRPSN